MKARRHEGIRLRRTRRGIRRLTIGGRRLASAALTVAALCWLWCAPASSLAADNTIWFDDLDEPLQLSTFDQSALGRAVWAYATEPGTDVDRLLATWHNDSAPRIVFVSVSNGVDSAQVAVGAGRGLAEAIRHAARQAITGLAGKKPVRWVRLDVVRDVLTLSSGTDATVLPWRRKMTGLASDRAVGLAMLPEELVAQRLVDEHGSVRRLVMAAYLLDHPNRGRPYKDLHPWHHGKIHRFTTVGAFCDESGTVPLVAGRRYDQPVRRDDLEAAARLAGRYLARCVMNTGRFVYSYRPCDDSTPSQYNMLRHAGTTYAMLEIHERTGDKSLLDAAIRAVDYLVSTVQPIAIEGSRQQWIVERGYAKLGGNALAVLALTKHVTVTGDRSHLPLAQKLAAAIISVQDADGRFSAHKVRQRDGVASTFVSEYYPGEVIFALARLYSLDRDKRWLDAAAASTAYLINQREKGKSIDELIHDHWLLYGLNELHRHRPEDQYLTHTRRIVAAIRKAQHLDGPVDDWRGGYYMPPRSTPTSTRTEGLAAACSLLRDFGDDSDEANVVLDAARSGAAFVLQLQLRPESAMFFPNPQRCLGGVKGGLVNAEVRIDYVQHAASCWLGVARVITDDPE